MGLPKLKAPLYPREEAPSTSLLSERAPPVGRTQEHLSEAAEDKAQDSPSVQVKK